MRNQTARRASLEESCGVEPWQKVLAVPLEEQWLSTRCLHGVEAVLLWQRWSQVAQYAAVTGCRRTLLARSQMPWLCIARGTRQLACRYSRSVLSRSRTLRSSQKNLGSTKSRHPKGLILRCHGVQIRPRLSNAPCGFPPPFSVTPTRTSHALCPKVRPAGRLEGRIASANHWVTGTSCLIQPFEISKHVKSQRSPLHFVCLSATGSSGCSISGFGFAELVPGRRPPGPPAAVRNCSGQFSSLRSTQPTIP